MFLLFWLSPLFLLFYCTIFPSLCSPNDASIYRLQWQLLLHLSTMVAILCQWLVELLLTIFSCHQQSTIVWQNSTVIFEKSHIPYMKLFLAEIWSVDRSLSQKSNKIEFRQLDFCGSRYSILNDQRSTLAECEIWLWRLRFPCSFFFIFLALNL